MQIEELTLHTQHLADQKAFYHTLLGLPLLWEAADSFTLQAGTTRLCFQETELDVLYHLAFSIPGTTFQEVKQWVHERVPLLTITKSRRISSPQWEWMVNTLRSGRIWPGNRLLALHLRRCVRNRQHE